MITYKVGCVTIDWEQLFRLYKKIGLVAGLAKKGEYSKVKEAFTHSYRVVTAWNDNELVGAGRLVSDGLCYGMIFDLGVWPEYQKMGIGKGLLERLLSGNEHLRIHLTSTFGNEGFYLKHGFKPHKTALAKYPFPSEYLLEE